jgi:hypothetical protein
MSDPIAAEQRGLMNHIARTLDVAFNGDPPTPPKTYERKVGFVLFSFNFGQIDNGRVNYISNADRADMIVAVKEWLARAEGRVAETPRGHQ